MEKKKREHCFSPRLLGKRNYFRSRSNTRLHQQDTAGVSEVMGQSLHRNRSLKQLFGELPTVLKSTQEFTSRDRGRELQVKHNGPVQKQQKKADAAVKRPTSKMQDEYLLKKPRRKQMQLGLREGRSGCQKEEQCDKRRDKNGGQQLIVRKDDNKLKLQVYNPAAYDWRNTPSKDKKDRLNKHPISPRMPAIVQSEYFPSLNNSDKNKAEQTKQKKADHNSKQMSRSSSSDSARKLGLRPRVVKHIFQPRSPGRRDDDRPKRKQNLLFTFGL